MLKGIIRDSISKANAKALKKDGYLIANIYGKEQENIHCAFKHNEFIRFMKNKPSLSFNVELDSKAYKVVVKEYQKNPVTNDIIHADLMIVNDHVLANYKIPVRAVGTPIGLKNKGVLIYLQKRVSVKCLGANLINEYVLDVSNLDVGDNILIRDLPSHEGVQILGRPSVGVVAVIKAK